MFKKTVYKEKNHINEVPMTIFRPKHQEFSLTLLYYHGWTSNVENYEFLGESFAAQGIQVIMPEVLGHGQRHVSLYYLNQINNLVKTMEQTYDEFLLNKDILIERYALDKHKLVIGGHSMGAMISAYLFMTNPQFNELHMFSGLFDTSKITQAIHIDAEDIVSEESLNFIHTHNPYDYLDKLENRKIYIYNGWKDDVIKTQYMEKVKQEVVVNHNLSQLIHFNFYEEAGHDLTFKMLRDSLSTMTDLYV